MEKDPLDTEYQELFQQLQDACEGIIASFAPLIETLHKMAEKIRELFSKLFLDVIIKFRRYGFCFTLMYHWHFPHWLARFIANVCPARWLPKVVLIY